MQTTQGFQMKPSFVFGIRTVVQKLSMLMASIDVIFMLTESEFILQAEHGFLI